MNILIIIFLVLFLILALRKPDWALFLNILLLPSYLIRFSALGVPMTLFEAMVLISFIVWAVREWPGIRKRISGKEKRIPYPFGLEIILLLILSFISIAVAGMSFSAMGIWKAYFFEPILLFILVLNIFQGDSGRKKLFLALSLSALSVIVLAIYQKITGDLIANHFWAAAETRRVVSWFGYPNAVALFLAPLIALFVGVFYSLRNNGFSEIAKKIFLAIIIISGFLSIFFAKSEGALIALLVALFVFAILADKKKRYIAIGFAASFLLACFIYQPLGNLVVNKLSFQDLSGQIRLQQWQETRQTLKGSSFLLGNGLSAYQEAVAPYHQEGIFFNYDNLDNFDAVVWASPELQKKYWQPVEIYLYPHNILLNFWTEIGLLGAVLFLWIMIKASIIAYRLFKAMPGSNKFIALGFLIAMISIFVHGLVDVPYFKNDLAAIFFILLAIIAQLKIESDNKA